MWTRSGLLEARFWLLEAIFCNRGRETEKESSTQESQEWGKKRGRNKFATAGFKSWLLWSMCRLEKECSDSEWGVKKAKFIEIRNAASAVE